MSAADLRTRAAACLAQARTSGPKRAAQLRACAKEYRRQALQIHLYEHGKAVGRTNVTTASFHQYLRANAQPSPRSRPS
jgi:hypothetical protein